MGKDSLLRGKKGEEKAVEYLIAQGFDILERNFHSKFGEVDIIARKNGILHFIEVKSSERYEPIYAITPAKLSKILRTVEYYRMKHRSTLAYQIDALLVRKDAIELVENISM